MTHHGDGEGQDVGQEQIVHAQPAGYPLGKARHGQRGEQHHRALGKIEHAGGLENQNEAQRHQRIQHAAHQAAKQGFKKKSHVRLPQWLAPR
jgi:hypothetical protein